MNAKKGSRGSAARRLQQIVDGAKGDDLERACRVFGGMSDSDLDQKYGESQQTIRQILQEYQDNRREWQEARDLLEELLRGKGL